MARDASRTRQERRRSANRHSFYEESDDHGTHNSKLRLWAASWQLGGVNIFYVL